MSSSIIYHLLFFHSLHLISSLPSFPISPLHSVTRRRLQPDLIKPTFCPTSCEKVFGSIPYEQSNEGLGSDEDVHQCLCVCPNDRPIYINNLGYCVDRSPEECSSAVIFDDFPLDNIPVLSISNQNDDQRLINATVLSWSNEFTTTGSFVPNCTVDEIFIDSSIHRWDSFSVPFTLSINNDSQPVINFKGEEDDIAELAGALIQLKIACRALEPLKKRRDEISLRPALMCITFRIEGESVSTSLELFHGDAHVQVIILGTIACLLLLALIASAVSYLICWRIQKRRLIGNIQLQFLQHLKNSNLALHQGSVMSPLPHSQQQKISSSDSDRPSNVIQKRRLYFSAEFLEPDFLLNPPPMAEQFLCDIRRMIDLAKERIKARKYLPKLNAIIEENEKPHKMDTTLDVVVESSSIQENVVNQAEESPRSAKSTDSGRETMELNSSSDESLSKSEEDEEEDEKNTDGEIRRQRKSSIPVLPSRQPRLPPPQPTTTPPSVPPKPTSLPSMIPRLGQSSPRSIHHSITTPLDPFPLSISSTSSIGPSQRRHERRKAYAVFPVDPMLNKSLPRRPRRPYPAVPSDC